MAGLLPGILTSDMKRRQFIAWLGSAAAWPLAARAQQPAKVPTIGLLVPGTPSTHGQWFAALVRRLRELGWIEGGNITIEYRWAAGSSERFAEIAAEFVRLKVDVIATSATGPTLAKQATSSIPIVFAGVGDAVGSGIVANLARPSGNVTGLSVLFTDLAGKRLELLREILPGLRRLAILTNIGNPSAMLEVHEVEATVRTLGLESVTPEVRRPEDIAPAVESLKDGVEALYVISDPVINTNRIRINTLALRARIPTMHSLREYVEVGGLISYGPNVSDMFRRAGELVDKILRGAKPADIPVEQPTKFDLVINLTTAKALGLTVPLPLMARADEVIE
jgi:putative tryptophan/tyrosine transport system substrate-binding protein